MIRLTDDDSVPRVEDATERHMRLCNQSNNAEKYKLTIQPIYNDFKVKILDLENAQKEIKSAQDIVWLCNGLLLNVLRDLNGRAKEYDRNNAGSKASALLFQIGNISEISKKSDKELPEIADSIAQKVIALGKSHELLPFADKIKVAVEKSNAALATQSVADKNENIAKTNLSISKHALVEQYNATYFTAASDVNKAFAENLYPQLRSAKKKSAAKPVAKAQDENKPTV